MKTNHLNKLAGFTMALALTLGFALSASAQYQATGADGITASPKAREVLASHSPSPSAVTATTAMRCANCKDSLTARIDTTARGANKPVIQVASHLCKMCDTELKTQGVGKAAKTIAVHACDSCSVASAN